MTAHDRFFQGKQAAAVLKHGILKRYPTVFISRTGSKVPGGRVVYLDGFAGPGRYEPEEGQSEGSEGSPLLAVGTAAAVETFRRTLHCVFVERNPRHFANLRETLARKAPQSMVYEVLRGDVSQHLGRVLTLAQDSPLLAFLDPFGTGLPYAGMAGSLLARPSWPPTEVLLNFNLQSVWRIGGLLTGDDIESPDGFQSRNSSLARIDEFLGDDWWREVFRTARNQAETQGERAACARAAQKVARAYCDRIEKDTGYRAFTVPIRREPGHQPLFMMILFYRHPVAPFVFNDAASKANEDWRTFTHKQSVRRQTLADEPEDLFGRTLVQELVSEHNARAETRLNQGWIDAIANNITTLIAARGPVSVRNETKAVYGDTLGLARETHLRKAWDQLNDRGIVRPRLKGRGNKIENQTIYPA